MALFTKTTTVAQDNDYDNGNDNGNDMIVIIVTNKRTSRITIIFVSCYHAHLYFNILTNNIPQGKKKETYRSELVSVQQHLHHR